MHSASKHLENWLKIFHFPTSSGASEGASQRTRERASEASSAEQAVRSKRTSERCERTSERMSEWPSTYISISRRFESLSQRPTTTSETNPSSLSQRQPQWRYCREPERAISWSLVSLISLALSFLAFAPSLHRFHCSLSSLSF